jgi:amino acid adenylation domain-containing protein
MFVFLLNNPDMERQIAGLKAIPFTVHTGKAMFDLLLAVSESNSGLRAELVYNRELFDESTILRMVSQLGRILVAVGDDPESRISELPLLSAEEQRQLLLEWNNTAQEFTAQQEFIHQAIERQARQGPWCIAVVFEGAALTYAELNENANRLARKLHSLGAGRGTLVGICMERSLEMVVGLVGILKAGAAYVPLDPNYPRERLAWMMQDADTPVLLIQEKFRDRLCETGARVLSIDAQWSSEIAPCNGANPDVPLTGDDLVYVIYTSGSTGKPKAAMNTHSGIRNRLLWGQETFQLSNDDRVLQKTPFSFDVSVWEFFWPLIVGARLVVARPGGHQDTGYLVKLIQEQRITIIHFVASMLQIFLEEADAANCATLKRVMCSGEALSLELKDKFFFKFDCELHDLYGPTEASVEVTWWECRKDGLRTVPIGRPIANTRMYVLDEEMQPTPIGVPGELYIGGTGVARGYWRRPELTAERFVPDLFSPTGGELLYRTGDVARYHRDGWIEYLGRTDHQVKIRGFRIELGEIEAALLHQESVKEAVVLCYEHNPGDKRLAAYVVCAEQAQETQSRVEELKAGIREELPSYMVPSAFVLLEKMPLLPNGKVNRNGLPAPELSTLPANAYVGPRNMIELQLVQIWEELLSVQPVGVRDNFFDLGGHSLAAIQLSAHIRQQMGHTIPIGFLLQNPTIESLAVALREQVGGAKASCSALVKIKTGKGRVPLFFVHPVGGNVLCYAGLSRHLTSEQPFYGLQAPGEEQLISLEDMATHYLSCLRLVQAKGPYYIGGWSMGGAVAYEMGRQLEFGGEQAEIFLIDTQAPPFKFAHDDLDDQSLMAHFISDLESLTGKKTNISVQTVESLEKEQAVKIIANHLRERQIVPPEFGSEELATLFNLFTNNMRALLTYCPGPYAGPVTLMKSSASGREHLDPALGWRNLVTGLFEVVEIEGDHYSIVTGAQVARLPALLEEKLSHGGRLAEASHNQELEQ